MKSEKKVTNKLPSMRANYNWTSKVKKKILGLFGTNGTELTYKCGHSWHTIFLKGVHVPKLEVNVELNTARLMRKRGNIFYFFVDLSVHGVTKTDRKRGGYVLYIINMDGGVLTSGTRHYSIEQVNSVGCEGLEFYNVFWKVLKHLYYNVPVEENMESDNSR